MRVVVDTNVLISGIFFGGNPQAIVDAVADGVLYASASPSMLEEYGAIVEEIVARGYGSFDASRFDTFIERLDLLKPSSRVHVCRDPDDDKFIECAIDAKALYIVSGDKDLLDIESYEGVKIVTAAEFRRRYL